MTGDHLVVLRAIDPNRHAAKIHTLVKGKKGEPDRIKTKGYSEAKHFSVEQIPVGNIHEYHNALDQLTHDPLAFIIRGAPKSDINRDHTRRLKHKDPNTGDPATFEPCPRRGLMIDFDHQPEPPLTDLITRPVDAVLYLVGRLPPECQDVTFFWQWGSSQGLPSDLGFLSLHVWFWCARAYSDEELIRWANFVNRDGQIIDPAVFRTVQANYIAQPLFLGGLIDPLPQRQGIWLGIDHEIEIIIPPADPQNPERISDTGYEPGLGIGAYLARIGGPEGIRHPILQTIGSFVAIHGGKADPQPLYRDIRKAVANADHGARSPDQIERYVSDQHLDEMLAWIRLQHGDQPPKGFVTGPPEEFDDNEPPPPTETEEDPPDQRPVVHTGGGRLHESVDEAERILVKSDPQVYAFGDQIVRPAPRPIPIADDKTTVGLRLVPVTPEHMADRFSRLIDFQKYNAKSQTWVSIDCPRVIALTYLARVGLWRAPQLKMLTTCPLLLADGRILDKPGFDPASGILFDPQGVEFEPVPDLPTKHGAHNALALLMEPFRDYPFVDDPSKSVLRSLLLSTVSRLAYPYVPCHAFDATGAGTGKSKLFDCASILQTGRECAVVSQPADATEFEKKLFASLLAGDPLVSIDNCDLPLDNSFLCMSISQRFVQSRLLGLSKNPQIPNTVMIGANGNNFSFTGDMLRRGLTGHLDAGVEKAWEREFQSEDPVSVFKRERAKLVAAALTVLRAYIIAGRPRSKAPPLGGFEEWCRTVRDAILWLDGADPCLTIESARKADPAEQRRGVVLAQWLAVLSDRSLTTREVVDEACSSIHPSTTPNGPDPNHRDDQAGRIYYHPAFRNALLDVAGERGYVEIRKLGTWLGNNKSKVTAVSDLNNLTWKVRIIADTDQHGLGRWRLQTQRQDGDWH
jgi:hypothetical protein